MNMKKTILSAALLAATSLAFAQGNKPVSPPANTGPAIDRPAQAPSSPPASEFGRDTGEQARELGTDAEARATFGADVSAEARARNGRPVIEDPIDEEPIEDPVDDDPIDDPIDDPVEPMPDPIENDQDGDGIPDDIDDDADGDGVSDNSPLHNNRFGQETRDATRDPERDGGMGPEQGDRAHERNELRSMDTDGDGVNDYLDSDADGDGIIDEAQEGDDDGGSDE